MLTQLRTFLSLGKRNSQEKNLRTEENARASARAHKELGNTSFVRNDFAAAEKHYRDALAEDANYEEAYNNLGTVLTQTERFGEAIECYLRAIAIKPDYPVAYLNLGNWHKAHGNVEDQIRYYKKAVELKPDYYEAYNNLGSTLRQQGQVDEAIDCFEKVLALKADFPLAYLNLGLCYRDKRDMEREIAYFSKTIAVSPDYWDAHIHLGYALLIAGDLDKAEHHFRTVLKARPEDIQARFNLGVLLLQRGNYKEGFELYEARFEFFSLSNPEVDPHFFTKACKAPRWNGEDLGDKSLLVWMEQGLGDCIMMMRFLPQVAAFCPKRLVLLCRAPLTRLFDHVPYHIETIDFDTELRSGVFDYHVALTSLPHLLGTTLETLPTEVPYISGHEAMKLHWKERLAPTSGLKVGLVWAGNSKMPRDFLRSMPFSNLAPLAQIPDCTFISLQKGDISDEAAQANWLDHENIAACNDFLDTAALVDNLDLVISVDTATAHLAGALGKPVWLLCRYESEWRWLMEREDSPWYPSMRIFRQPSVDDWPGVIERIHRELRILALEHNRSQPVTTLT